MRVGIVTFDFANNYGAVLQAYALQEVIRQMGHDAFFVRYAPDYHARHYRMYFPRRPVDLFRLWLRFVHMIQYGRFRNSFFSYFGLTYSSTGSIQENPPKADVYVVGSDQVWNPLLFCSDYDPAYFLKFGKPNVRRVSYAPSFGDDSVDCDEKLLCLTEGFDSLSVREPGPAMRLAEISGRPVSWVLDPSLIMDSFETVTKGVDSNAGSKFLFYYYNKSDTIEVAKAIAKANGLKLIVCGGINKWWRGDPYTVVHPSPQQWVAYIKNAEFVVATSFHAVAFSIVYKRPFVYVPSRRVESIANHRICSLLSRLKLDRRILSSDQLEYCLSISEEDIDWNQAYSILEDWRKESMHFLKTGIMGVDS